MSKDQAPRAVVREVDGQIVLDDPDALAVIKGIGKANCRRTFEAQAERVAHFKRRIHELGREPDEVLIVLLNVDDPNGGQLAEVLMPGQEETWETFRRAGQIPFARGLAARPGIEDLVSGMDPEAGEKLRALRGKVAVVVMDHETVEVFEAP